MPMWYQSQQQEHGKYPLLCDFIGNTHVLDRSASVFEYCFTPIVQSGHNHEARIINHNNVGPEGRCARTLSD